MADVDTIMDAVETDIRKLVCQIDPNQFASHKFTSPKSLRKRPITEDTGKERLFKITWPEMVPLSVGAATMIWTIKGAITIGYPLHDWDVARASDYRMIFDALHTNAPGVSGCSFRVIDALEPPTRDDDEENKWSWTMIPIRAVIETS